MNSGGSPHRNPLDLVNWLFSGKAALLVNEALLGIENERE
jgi:hypothetical protein